jgi:hypothetical protein
MGRLTSSRLLTKLKASYQKNEIRSVQGHALAHFRRQVDLLIPVTPLFW